MAETANRSITGETRVVASKRQLSTNLAGEAVILGLRDSVYYGLDGAGARMWELVQQPAIIRDVAASVSDEYDVTPEAALRDLLTLAADLVERGLLAIVPDAAT